MGEIVLCSTKNIVIVLLIEIYYVQMGLHFEMSSVCHFKGNLGVSVELWIFVTENLEYRI